MKKVLYIVMAALLCVLLAMAAMAGTDAPTICQACGTSQTWEVMPASWGDLTPGHYHYYLNADVTPAQLLTNSGVSGITICLDLNGHSINTVARSMVVYNVVNIMDSSAGETGYMSGSATTGTSRTIGGTISVSNGGTLRLYSGTLKYKKNDSGYGVCKGGIVAVEAGGKMEMFGGRIEGGDTVHGTLSDSGFGAAIYVYQNASLQVTGGEIISGTVPAGAEGKCVLLCKNTAKLTLGGDARVEEICSKALGNITVTGTYTGAATVRYTSGVSLSDGTVIGDATDADISGAELVCGNGDGYEIQKVGNDLVLKTFTSTAQRHMCKHCNTLVDWKPLAGNTGLFATAGHHHLYLTENYTGTQLNAKDGAQVCMDLYGKTVYADGRAYHVGANGQLNIMDTVGGSTVTGTSANSNPSGGAMAVNGSGAVLNIYDGIYRMVQDGTGRGVGNGGVLYMSNGTANLYGGKLEGGDLVISTYPLGANGYGAAVYMAGSTALNLYGGEITSGTVPEGRLGECVYLDNVNARVTLSGDACVEEIFCKKDTQPIIVTGIYTGTAAIRFPENQVIAEEMPVGTCAGADISGANLTCVNGDGYCLSNKDGVLVISSFGLNAVAAVYSSTGSAGFKTLQEAVNACTDGYVKLLKSTDEAASVTKDLYLDLNGQSAVLNAAEGVTVYGFDCQTDDYTVSDGEYGKLTVTGGTVTGLPAGTEFAEDGYLTVVEAGKYTFHRVKLEIYAMSLRPDAVGLYYKSDFQGDEKVAANISTYGVALSLLDEPTEEILDSYCEYSVFENFESGAVGNIGNASSTLLKGIMKQTNSDAKNRKNLRTCVYGRAYAKTADGQILFGKSVERSLQEQLQAVDGMLDTLAEVQVKAAVEMYKTYETVLQELNLTNLAAAAESGEEDGTLKILVIGNSHGLDSTNLLYEVFHAERPQQKLVLGALYVSGCNMQMHADYMQNNTPAYQYYKNDGTAEDRAWTITNDYSCLDALRDEQWDVIVLQQQNHHSGLESTYVAERWEIVFDYVRNNQDHTPKILWNMLWTNPDNYDLYIGAGAPLAHPQPESYQNTYEAAWPNAQGKYDHKVLYEKIVKLTQKYLVGETEFLGDNQFDDILPCAAAVEYALDVVERPQQEIFRDWTHLNDYGRLIVSYVWYAKLMGLEQIDAVHVDSIPAVLHHAKSAYPADLTFDAQMKADLITCVNFALQNPYWIPSEN